MNRCLTAILLLVPAWAGSRQSGEIPVFRVTSRQVVVEFLAVDKKTGEFVNDLSPDEIEVKLDGRKQELVRLFPPEVVREGAAAGTMPDRQEPAAGRSPASSPSATDFPEAPARTVILLDSRVMDAGNFGFSVNAVRKFIENSLGANHYVMVAAIDRRLKVLQQFTRDRAKLLEAVGKLRPVTVRNRLDTVEFARRPDPAFNDRLLEQMHYLGNAMRLLSYSLSAVPGRKHVVFFSEGYPLNPLQDLEVQKRFRDSRLSTEQRQLQSREVAKSKDPHVLQTAQEMVSLANNFGISYYTIDARGLIGVPGLDAGIGPDKGISETVTSPNAEPDTSRGGGVTQDEALENLQAIGQTTLNDLANAPNFLVALAAGTNGTAFYNRNDLGIVLRASTREQQNVYLAAFAPEGKGRKGRFRRIDVKTTRPNILIRHQIGFVETPLDQIEDNRIALALERPDLFQNLTTVIQIDPGRKTSALVGMLGAQVSTRPAAGGKKRQFEVVVVAQVYDEQGKAVYEEPPLSKEFRMEITPEQYQGLVQQNLVAPLDVSLQQGSYSLVVVVEDRISGMLGVGSQRFTVQ